MSGPGEYLADRTEGITPVEDLPYRAASWHLWRDHRVFVPFATIQDWVEAGREAEQPVGVQYLAAVRTEFSGYIAADELYDGPFRVLSIVDDHTFQRIACEILDHDPTHADIKRFFSKFQVDGIVDRILANGRNSCKMWTT